MNQYLEPLTKSTLLFAAMFVITALGIAVVRRIRGSEANDMSDSSEMMTKFRDLHAEGGLSDQEFRTIKTKLASDLKAELNSNSNTG